MNKACCLSLVLGFILGCGSAEQTNEATNLDLASACIEENALLQSQLNMCQIQSIDNEIEKNSEKIQSNNLKFVIQLCILSAYDCNGVKNICLKQLEACIFNDKDKNGRK